MNKLTTFLLLCFLGLLSMTAPVSRASGKSTDNPKQQAGTPHDLTFFFSNDVRGETEPCG